MNEEIQIILETTEKVLQKNINHQLRQNINQNNNDVFKISESLVGSNPIKVQELSTNIIVEFIQNIRDQKNLSVIRNQREMNLNFHVLDLKTIKEISKN